MASSGRTFVVRVYADGSPTVEDVRTGQRVAVGEIGQIGALIAQWLTAPDGATPAIDLRASASPEQPVGDDHAW